MELDLEDIVIPEGTTEINEYTVRDHRKVRSVKIPSSVVIIGDRAFADCVHMVSVEMPEGLMAIGKRAFYNCASLESVEIPEGIKTIETGAFEDCINLESLVIPETVTNIKADAFANCTGIKNLVIPDNLTSCAASAFPYSHKYLPVNKVYRYQNGTMVNTKNSMLLFYNGFDKVVKTPDDACGISYRAFAGSNAEFIRLAETVKSISDEAFIDCDHEVKIIIPESVDYIESSAFDLNTKILCNKGSYAENWCRESDFKQLPDEEA